MGKFKEDILRKCSTKELENLGEDELISIDFSESSELNTVTFDEDGDEINYNLSDVIKLDLRTIKAEKTFNLKNVSELDLSNALIEARKVKAR